MSRVTCRKQFLGIALAGLAFVAASGFISPAQAAELSDMEVGRELVRDLKEALRAKQTDEIQSHVVRIADTYGVVESASVRARLMKALGRASRFKDEGVRRAALRAFAETGDAAAWKYVSPFLRQSDRKQPPAYFDEAVRVAETLKADAAVKDLLDLVKKSKHLGVAGRAMEALSVFGQSKHRVKILGSIIDTTRKEKPGVKGRENPNYRGPRYTGEEARNRWEALARPMVATANKLTGQEIGTASEWFVIWRNHKRAPVALFENPVGA